MYLIFKIFLPIFWTITMIAGIFMVGCSSLAHKKIWTGCIIVAVLVLWALSGHLIYLAPFGSPEEAYAGMHSRSTRTEDELLTIEGETSAWVLDEDNSQFVLKEGDNWNLTGFLTLPSPYYVYGDDITISVEGPSTSRDRYVCVRLFPAPEECRIDTPQHTVFYEEPGSDIALAEYRLRTFYAYIGTLEEDFQLTVNGTEFTIPTTAQFMGPSRFFMDSFRQMICFALIILGIILICRRGKRIGRQAAAIFGVIVLGLSLGTLASVYPLETVFMTYQSPEPAFYYIHNSMGKLTVEGNLTSLVADDRNCCIIQKTDDGWKHPFPFEPKTIYTSSNKSTSITVYRDGASGECYLRIDTPKHASYDILPEGRWFSCSEYPTAPSDAMAVFYGYLGTLEAPFQITIDGAAFTIPEA